MNDDYTLSDLIDSEPVGVELSEPDNDEDGYDPDGE